MPVQGQKFIIIGGAGFVGSALARRLLATSSTDIIICDSVGPCDGGKWVNLPAQLADLWTPGSLMDNLDKSWRETAGVVLMADAGPGQSDGDAIFDAAYHVPRRVWDFCVAKQRPIYWASSAHVYGQSAPNLSTNPDDLAGFEPTNAFGRAKLAFDMFAARQGTGPSAPPITTGFRLSSLYGRGEAHKGQHASLPARAISCARSGETLQIWAGSQALTRDWVHVDDAASAMAEVILGEKAGFFDIGSGQTTSTEDVVKAAKGITGQSLSCDGTMPAPYQAHNLPAANITNLTTTFRSLSEGLKTL
jgi:nucleoside-diphosphate-sugar epimerase